MITSPTVLILGAGASEHLNFPLGKALGDGIVAQLGVTESPEFRQLIRLDFSADHIHEFRNAFRHSGKTSIDAFLEHRIEFLSLGKAAISQRLIPLEEHENLFVIQANWYQYLYDRMNADFGEFGRNRLAVITYNYDRSLEQYLLTAMKHSYGKNDHDVTERISSIQIIHLHGQLGRLPWQGSPSRKYTVECSDEAVRTSMDSIKIIHEDIGSDQHFVQAHTLLSEASRIIFIGFGYDETNLERLTFDLANTRAELYGSCFGFTMGERNALSRRFNRPITLGLPPAKALEFLRDVGLS